MAEQSKPQPLDRDGTVLLKTEGSEPEADLLQSEQLILVQDDETEVYDLGFIIEDRCDDRARRRGWWCAAAVFPRNLAAETDEALFAARNGLHGDPDR
jgi:hypothetical protein